VSRNDEVRGRERLDQRGLNIETPTVGPSKLRPYAVMAVMARFNGTGKMKNEKVWPPI